MSEKIKGLTLQHIKYSETSIVLHVYSIKYGLLSLLIKGFYAKKKKMQACQYPFTEVEFVMPPQADNDKLINIYSLDIVNYLDNIYTHPVKNLQVQLLAEIMNTIFKQEPGNKYLYQEIQAELNCFNQKKHQFADFHLFFIKNVAEYLGLKPDITNKNSLYFNLKEAQYLDNKEVDFNVDLETSALLRRLFHLEFNENSENYFNQNQRAILLDALLKYLEYHIPNFRTPKSLEIIKMLLN